jgi:hypothetical protein
MQTLQQSYPADYESIKNVVGGFGVFNCLIDKITPVPIECGKYTIFTIIVSRGTVMYLIYDRLIKSLNICYDTRAFDGFGHIATLDEMYSLIKINKQRIIHGFEINHLETQSFIDYCNSKNL